MFYGRAIQLMILSPQLGEIYRRQHAKALETQALFKEIQKEIGKIAALRPQHEILLEKLRDPEYALLAKEKSRLTKEINELNSQYSKLLNEIQLLKETAGDLKNTEERTMEQIINLYERMHKGEKWFNFIVNFSLGVFSSILAAIFYNLANTKYEFMLKGKLIELVKKFRSQRKRSDG
jgi:transposase